jgi:hypothetical protein
MSPEPVENFELQAVEQRNRLHDATSELKGKIAETRQRLDPRRNVREHFVAVAAGVSVLSLLAGYAVAGMFTRQ